MRLTFHSTAAAPASCLSRGHAAVIRVFVVAEFSILSSSAAAGVLSLAKVIPRLTELLGLLLLLVVVGDKLLAEGQGH